MGVVERPLEQFLEFLHGQASVFDDPAHGESVDGSRVRDDNDPLAIGHGDVLAFANALTARRCDTPGRAGIARPGPQPGEWSLLS